MTAVNHWQDPAHARRYLDGRDEIPHRREGVAVLVEVLPEGVERVLDLGTGDGVLLDRVLVERPGARGAGVDFSPEMLERARTRFGGGGGRVDVLELDLDDPLPSSLGRFDAVVSSFAIHHCVDARKRTLYGEVFELLEPGGTFCNLDHVSSPTAGLHEAFLTALGIAPGDEDPSNKLAPLELQLRWLRAVGFAEVDCLWKWRELALMVGRRPA